MSRNGRNNAQDEAGDRGGETRKEENIPGDGGMGEILGKGVGERE